MKTFQNTLCCPAEGVREVHSCYSSDRTLLGVANFSFSASCFVWFKVLFDTRSFCTGAQA